MTDMHLSFVNGAIMMACMVAGLFFLRFWRTSRDRFFGLFALAFFLLAVDRIAITLSGGMNEVNLAVYFIRCLGFLIIIGAVIDKNRANS